MSNLIRMPDPSYKAKLFKVRTDAGEFHVAGTLDGYIDLALPEGGTLQLSPITALGLAHALEQSVTDVKAHCLYGRDALLNNNPGPSDGPCAI